MLPLSVRFACRSRPDTLPASVRSWSPQRVHGRVEAPDHARAFGRPVPHSASSGIAAACILGDVEVDVRLRMLVSSHGPHPSRKRLATGAEKATVGVDSQQRST
jgi:hypothetical protein